MADRVKCAHPPCACTPAAGSQYCSAYCEEAVNQPLKPKCQCGHAACTGIAAPLVEPGLIPEPAI